jgi:carotenoid 1,2-hydratase
MTERRETAVTRSATRFQVGPSAMTWDGTAFTVEIDEIAVPHLSRLRGRVRVIPEAVTGVELPMTADAAHLWRPFAPVARIEVAMERPAWRWSGAGYLDGNFGTRALEADFRYWTWARFPSRAGASILYDIARRDGGRVAAAVLFDGRGGAEMAEPPPVAPLSTTLWRVKRSTRADPGHRAGEVLRWEDGPFYARAAIRSRLYGEDVAGVHEALDLDRFRMRIVQAMLTTRMPRRFV